MVTYANGEIPLSVMRPVPAANGQTAYLLPGAAASFMAARDELARDHGFDLVVTSAGDGFRSLARQVAVFTQRYSPRYATVGGRVDRRVWNGVAFFRHTGAAAAVPGTSNHGRGITFDAANTGGYGSARFRAIKAVLEAHGWSNAEGYSVNESWHWNWLGDPNVEPIDNNGGTTTPADPWAGKDPNEAHPLGSRVLSVWSAGTDVAYVQGKVGATADGYFGENTRGAVAEWQRARGLDADGVVGPITWGRLMSGGGVPAPPFPLPGGHYFGPKSGPAESVSGYYSHRDDLRRWQQRMADRGWHIGVDGLYGDQTGDVAEAFQREKGLTVDRKIGPQTWAAAWTAPIT